MYIDTRHRLNQIEIVQKFIRNYGYKDSSSLKDDDIDEMIDIYKCFLVWICKESKFTNASELQYTRDIMCIQDFVTFFQLAVESSRTIR